MHAEFRPLVAAYCLFVIAQFATGFWLYAARTGPGAADAFEYYRGSEAALQAYPERPAGFMPAKTFAGVLKTQAPHSIAFAIVFFVLAHLARSMTGGSSRAVRGASALFAIAAVADFLLPFALLCGPPVLFTLRFPVLAAYSICGISLSIYLCVLCFRARSA